MRSFVVVLLMVMVAAVAVASASKIPEEVDSRLEELNKWFDARLPIYKKANYLLKKLGKDVSKLSDLHGGIKFYYRDYSDLQYYTHHEDEDDDGPRPLRNGAQHEPKLRVVKLNGTTLDTKPMEELVQKALESRDVKHILLLAPEITSAVRSIMKQ